MAADRVDGKAAVRSTVPHGPTDPFTRCQVCSQDLKRWVPALLQLEEQPPASEEVLAALCHGVGAGVKTCADFQKSLQAWPGACTLSLPGPTAASFFHSAMHAQRRLRLAGATELAKVAGAYA